MNRNPPRYDVVVIGAGSAGLAAGITAARAGARTLVVERSGYAGGMGTASLVHSFCGLYFLRTEPGAVLANPGICGEIEQRMIAATGIGPRRYGRVDVLPQHPVEFVRIADEMLAAEDRLDLRYHTELAGVRRGADGWTIDLLGRGGLLTVAAAVMVDASGDAATAGFLGADTAMEPCGRLQRPAYVFGVQRTNCETKEENLATAGWIAAGVRAGELSKDALGISFRPSGRTGEWFGTIDLTATDDDGGYDPLDSVCLTRLEIAGRRIAHQVLGWLSRNATEWKGARISQWPARAGVRESRRWIGHTILTGDDILAGNRFTDEAVLATWPIELRENNRGPKLRFPIDNRPCGIPRGCLRPKHINRIWIAGRCISADHQAQASVRVMGTCFATGEAAGLAAAHEADGRG
ncbi:MAG: FAD-dependent oxidoreductase [Verrucomicrobiota bacterium]